MPSEPMTIAVIAAIPPTVAAVAALFVAIKGLQKGEQIHAQTNSRLTAMQENVSRLERLLGVADEKAAQLERDAED